MIVTLAAEPPAVKLVVVFAGSFLAPAPGAAPPGELSGTTCWTNGSFTLNRESDVSFPGVAPRRRSVSTSVAAATLRGAAVVGSLASGLASEGATAGEDGPPRQ